MRVVVVNSGAVVVGVVRSVKVVCDILSVVTDGVMMCGVVLVVVKGADGVTNSVIFVEMISGKAVVPVTTEGEAGRPAAVVKAVLGEPDVMDVVTIVPSTVEDFDLVSVCAEVVVLGTIVFSVITEVSRTRAELGLEAVTIRAIPVECVVASVVCTTIGVLLVVVPSREVVVRAAVVVAGSVVTGVVVNSGCRESVDLVEEVSQNRGVVVKEVLLVLEVLGPKGLTAELNDPLIHSVVLIIVVGGATVTLTVDSGSTTSGLTAVGTAGGDGGSIVLEGSGLAEGEIMAGGVSEELVCRLASGTVEVILVVEAVCGGAAEAAVVEAVVLRVLVEAVVLAVVGCAADGVTGCTATGNLIPVQPIKGLLEKQQAQKRDTGHEVD